MSREYTELLLQMVEEGWLDPDIVIIACVKYMSDDDVREMMEEIDPEELDTVIMACVKYMSDDDVREMMEENKFVFDHDVVFDHDE